MLHLIANSTVQIVSQPSCGRQAAISPAVSHEVASAVKEEDNEGVAQGWRRTKAWPMISDTAVCGRAERVE